jgi:hypothetical protein
MARSDIQIHVSLDTAIVPALQRQAVIGGRFDHNAFRSVVSRTQGDVGSQGSFRDTRHVHARDRGVVRLEKHDQLVQEIDEERLRVGPAQTDGVNATLAAPSGVEELGQPEGRLLERSLRRRPPCADPDVGGVFQECVALLAGPGRLFVGAAHSSSLGLHTRPGSPG